MAMQRYNARTTPATWANTRPIRAGGLALAVLAAVTAGALALEGGRRRGLAKEADAPPSAPTEDATAFVRYTRLEVVVAERVVRRAGGK